MKSNGKKGELRLMVDGLKATLRDDGIEMGKYLGDIREPVEQGRALAAWREMTLEDHMALLHKMGPQKMLEWYGEMSRRERQSNAAKTRAG